MQRVFLSLDLYETLGYEGVLVSPELVDDVLPIAQDEGKVPEEILEVFIRTTLWVRIRNYQHHNNIMIPACCNIELSEQ